MPYPMVIVLCKVFPGCNCAVVYNLRPEGQLHVDPLEHHRAAHIAALTPGEACLQGKQGQLMFTSIECGGRTIMREALPCFSFWRSFLCPKLNMIMLYQSISINKK